MNSNLAERLPDEVTVERMWAHLERELRSRHPRRARNSVIAVVVGFVLAGGGAAVYAGSSPLTTPIAVSSPDPARPLERQLTTDAIDRQREMHTIVDPFMALVDPGDKGVAAPIDGAPSGYGSLVMHIDTNTIDVYWAGAVPATVEAILRSNTSVFVVEHNVTYSLNDLNAAALKIEAFAKSTGLQGRGKLLYIKHAADSQSLIVAISASDPSVKSSDLMVPLSKIAGVPVSSVLIEVPGNHDLEAVPTPLQE